MSRTPAWMERPRLHAALVPSLAHSTTQPRPVFRGGNGASIAATSLSSSDPKSDEPLEATADPNPDSSREHVSELDARREARALRCRQRDAAESEAGLLELLSALSHAIQKMRSGDFSIRLMESKGSPDGSYGALSRQFDSLVEALENTVALNARFQSMAAHDMRSPLATIELALSALRGMCTQTDQRKLVDLIQESAHRQLEFVDSVLDAYALQAGRLELNRRPIDVNELMLECVNALRARAGRHRQTLVVSMLPEDPTVLCDPAKIHRVLDNLLANAIKYSIAGDTIELSCVEPVPGELRFEIVDHGPGLGQPEIATLFECFRRGPRTANTQGTGLGLAICKELVVAHGGRLWVESRRGAGCRFMFTLPRCPGSTEQTNT